MAKRPTLPKPPVKGMPLMKPLAGPKFRDAADLVKQLRNTAHHHQNDLWGKTMMDAAEWIDQNVVKK